MDAFLRVMRLLTMVVWVGGLIFFAFVVAPSAFHLADIGELTSKHMAGAVVADTLARLHPMGQIFGFVFLVATVTLWMDLVKAKSGGRKLLVAQMWLVILMMATTGYVQAKIVPQMERDRIAAGGDVDAAPADNPARLDFERLHPLSEKVEGAALFMGLGVVVLMGVEKTPA